MQEIVKYMTMEFVRYMNLTKEERKKLKRTVKSNAYTNRWFGLIPLYVKLWNKK